jgi:hypothetical protein
VLLPGEREQATLEQPPPAAPPGAPGLLSILTSPILLTGGYAWGVAVEPSIHAAAGQAFQVGLVSRPGASAVCGVLALLALTGGVILERARSRAAPLVGIWAFFGLLVACWLLAPSSIEIAKLDSLRGLLGAGGFALFALAWGVPDVFQRIAPEDNPRADTSTPLDARDKLPTAALPLAAVGIVATALMAFFAWRIHDSPRAMLAQALSGLAGVAVITAAAEIAVGRRGYVPSSPRSRMHRAFAGLMLLSLLGGAGLVQSLLLR